MGGDLIKVNFRLPRKQLEEIEKLVREGKYESISDFVREAVERLVAEYSGSRRAID